MIKNTLVGRRTKGSLQPYVQLIMVNMHFLYMDVKDLFIVENLCHIWGPNKLYQECVNALKANAEPSGRRP